MGRAKSDEHTRRADDNLPPPRWRQRGTLVLVAIALWLALIFAYATSAWDMALYRLLEDGGVLLFWLAAAAGAGAVILDLFRVADARTRSSLLHFVTATALGLGAFSLITLALGLLGALNHITAILLLALGIFVGSIHLWRRRWQANALRRWLAAPAGRGGWLALAAVPFASLMTVGALVPPYLLWSPQEPHGYDVVEYHLQVPREWFELGRIVPLHHNVFSFFPFNVEMHYLLGMHLRGGPWAGMYLAQLMHGALIALTLCAACGFANQLTPPIREAAGGLPLAPAPLITCLAMAATPWLAQLGAIAYDEGGFLLFGTLAIVWTIRALRDPELPFRAFALSGVFAGLACGSKLTAVPEVLVGIALVAALLLAVSERASTVAFARRGSAVAIFCVAGLLAFAPWLARTAVWSSGNPVFPELPSLGHGYFSDVQVERWRHAHAARPDQRSMAARLRAARDEILTSWQFGFLLIPAALAAIVLDRRNPDVWFLGAMLFLLAVFWLGFTHLQGRFFVLAVPICAMLIARLPPSIALPVVLVQAAIALALLNMRFLTPDRRQLIPVMLGTEDLTLLTPPALQSVPAGAPLTLVGDAKAFLYQRPMGLLRYRTVFDADTSNSRGVIEAWAGPPNAAAGMEYLLIDPNELRRFAKTYPPFPPLPPEINRYAEPFVVER